MRVLLPDQMPAFKRQVKKGMTVDSDLVEDYRRVITDMSPGDAPDVDKLVAEIRALPRSEARPAARARGAARPAGAAGAAAGGGRRGPTSRRSSRATPLMDEPAAYAERRFGTTGPFLRRRKWNLDFYLGSFADLAPHYRKLGYRRVYRLRAPYVSFGRSAYVLSPEPGLRPRLLYCEFYGQDLFLAHPLAVGRADAARQRRGADRDHADLPGLLLDASGRPGDALPARDHPVHGRFRRRRLRLLFLGPLEGPAPRRLRQRLLAALRLPAGRRRRRPPAAPPHELRRDPRGGADAAVRRGATAVYFAGPAAAVDPGAGPGAARPPTAFVTFEGGRVSIRNALARRPEKVLFSGLPSPLLATREWLKDARGHGVVAFDGRMARVAQESSRWSRLDGGPLELGIGAVLGEISSLHPEEDRAVYTVEYANQDGREAAKAQFRDAVLDALKAAARDKVGDERRGADALDGRRRGSQRRGEVAGDGLLPRVFSRTPSVPGSR